jgi:lysine-N-methylase
VSDEDRARIEGQGWDADPALAGQTLFVANGGWTRLAHRDDGACVFLNERGLCRIHAKFGEPAKPLACRLYPFVVVPVNGSARMDIRFDCPAVATNHGRPIPQHRQAVLGLLPQVLTPGAVADPAPFFGRVQLTWPQLARMAEAFDRLLCTDSLDVTRRLVGCANFAALLRTPRIAELEGSKLTEFLDTVVARVVQSAAKDELCRVRPSAPARPLFRQWLSIYGREDRIGAEGQTGARLSAAMRMVLGRGVMPELRPDLPCVPFDALEASFGIPDAEAAEPLLRYLRFRFSSLGFFGRLLFGRSFLDGINALFLAVPGALWFARAHALHRELATLDRDAMSFGVQVVDRRHGRIALANTFAERFRTGYLTDRATLRSLLVWYGT